MKTLKMKLALALMLPLSLLFFNGCDPDARNGEMRVMLTDAPGSFEKVNVDIKLVMVKYEDTPRKMNPDAEGWIALETNAGIYDLLSLQNGVQTAIAPDQKLPQGNLKGIRLVLGEQNSVVTGGIEFELKVPSGSESGLKIDMNDEIVAGEKSVFVLDFDAALSVHPDGNGGYILVPVIKLLK